MASIKYKLRGSSQTPSISLKLSVGRGKVYEKKTGLKIWRQYWDFHKGLPSPANEDLSEMKQTLVNLESYILDGLELSAAVGKAVNTHWLADQIDLFFNRSSEIEKASLVINVIEQLIEQSEKISAHNVSNTANGQLYELKQLSKLFSDFQGRRRYQIIDIDKRTANAFYSYLRKNCNYSTNYSRKILAKLKAACYYAEERGIQISPQLRKIQFPVEFSKSAVYLNSRELESIENLQLKEAYLINARKWMLIGCHTGLRARALLNLRAGNLDPEAGIIRMPIENDRTGEPISIPIVPKTLQILEAGWPHRISLVNLNLYVKEICLKANLVAEAEGKVFDKEIGRKVSGKYPKYTLISSDTFRRSFCHNYFGKVNTLSLMKICGFKTEDRLMAFMGQAD